VTALATSPRIPIVLATVVVDVIGVLGVLPASITVYGGAAAAWALLTGQGIERITEQLAYGAAVGFIVGIPLMICAGVVLALG
jgi:hypothetical protein